MSPVATVDPFFTATPKQAEFCEAAFSGLYTYLAYGGGIRSGKSAVAIILAQALCRIFPRSRWAIVRKDLPTLRRNVLPTFQKLRIEGFCGPVNQSTWISTCTNGSEIVFFTESASEDPEYNRWRGLEVNGFFLEEANELAEKSWEKAKERAGSWVVPDGGEQPPPFIIATFNPSPGWVKRVFYDPWDRGTIRSPYYFQPATIADNPHLPAAYLDSLKNLNERDYERFVKGNWSFISGAFFGEVSGTSHLVPSLKDPELGWGKLPAWWTYWGGFDWGFRHPAVFVAFAKDGDGTTRVLDTLRMHRTSDVEMVRMIHEKMPPQCLKRVYAGQDCFDKRQAHAASVESVADVFAARGVLLDRANVARVQGWAACTRALTLKQPDGTQGTPRTLIARTPGNLWGVDCLMEAIPDPLDVDDVLKVDANDDGDGGDDFLDAFRYGTATPGNAAKVPERVMPPSLQAKDDELERETERMRKGYGRGVILTHRPSGADGQIDPENW